MFPQLTEFLLANNLLVTVVKEVAASHLTALHKHFSSYFSDVNTETWVRDIFPPAATDSLTGKAEEDFLKARFQQVSHVQFWPSYHLSILNS